MASLSEHMRQAEHGWNHIRAGMTGGDQPIPQAVYSELLNELRKDAARTFWLYPLVEAKRGLPA